MLRQNRPNHILYVMVIKKSNLFITILLLSSIISCDSSTQQMYKLFGIIPMQFMETYKEEQMSNLNGDGYKVVVFNITRRGQTKVPTIVSDYPFNSITEPVTVRQLSGCQLDYTITKGSILLSGKTKVIWDEQLHRMIYIVVFN